MKSPKFKKHILAIECGHLSDKSVSGGDLILEKMTPYLLDDYKISVIIPKIGSPHWKHLTKVRLHQLPKSFFDKNPNPVIVILSYIERSLSSYLQMKKLDFDILYSSTNIAADVLPAYFFKLTKPKTTWVARIHHLIPTPDKRAGNRLVNSLAYFVQSLTLFMLNKADKIITLNENSKSELTKHGFKDKKLSVLPAGVNIEKIKKIKSTKLLYDAVFVGRMHVTKGILDLPLIWKKVRDKKPDSILIIIGEKNKKILQKLNEQISKLKLQKNMRILGKVEDKTLYKYLKSSKVFLFTDKEAGFSMATLEAMASGTPVIGYDIGILGTVFKKGYIKIPDGNIPKFSAAVLNIITNAKLRAKLSQEAKGGTSTFSWQTVSIKFKEILDGRKAQRSSRNPS